MSIARHPGSVYSVGANASEISLDEKFAEFRGLGLGLIRFLLASAVVFTHAGFVWGLMLTAGLVSVQAFFIISGFYMALILSEKYTTSYRTFYINRFLRIYPAYYIVILSYLPLLVGLYVRHHYLGPLNAYMEYPEVLGPGTFLFFILTNLVIFGQDVVLFLGFNPVSHGLEFTTNFLTSKPCACDFLLIGPTWSLSLELVFYLLAPFLVRWKTVNLLGLTAASLLLRYFLATELGLEGDPWAGRFFPTEIALFLFGVLSYRLYSRFRNIQIHASISIAVFLSVLLMIIFYSNMGINRWFFYSLLIVAIPLIFNLTKHNRIDRYVGDLSYLIYISHGLVGWMLGRYGLIGVVSVEYRGLAVLAVTVVFSMAVVKITNPIERYREKLAKSDRGISPRKPALADEAAATKDYSAADASEVPTEGAAPMVRK
jgi:peptidoglycan/LPS O-acetylase OafA/YrhL